MNGLAYFPWVALLAACVIAITFLVLWSIAEVRLDEEADTVWHLVCALEECEDELAAERMRSDELREELTLRDREIAELRRQVERAENPLLRGTQVTAGAVNG